MRERIVIVFVAVAIGLIVTTLAFFLYQQTRKLPDNISSSGGNAAQTQTQTSHVYLVVDEPQNESLSERRTIQVHGQTDVENIIVVSTNQEDIVAKPTTDGKFSVSIDIDTGANKIITRAISPNGDTNQDIRVVTYNTEEF